jgi:type VI secretion system protein ImpF
MADPNPQDRLQPFLLDRLIDEEPQSQVEAADRRSMTGRRFRQSVLRDLAWLLNARMHPKHDGLSDYELVAKSVLNFGLPEIAGSTESSTTPADMERMVRSAILAFEPRIVRSSLAVRAVEATPGKGPNPGHAIVLEIKGDIRVHPMTEPIYVKTNVDLETGHCEIQE